MVGMYTNDYLKNNSTLQTPCQMLFFQKMQELLNRDTPIHSSYRIHNAYTILCELRCVIDDYYCGKNNEFSISEVLSEARELFEQELVISSVNNEFYKTIKHELTKKLDVKNFNDESRANLSAIYQAICIFFTTYDPIKYQQLCTRILKKAISDNNNEKVLILCQALVSSLIYSKRTIRNIGNDLGYYFITSQHDFSACWKRWATNLLRYNAKYTCLIELPDQIKDINLNGTMLGSVWKESALDAEWSESAGNGFKENKKYFVADITAPANDIGNILQQAFDLFLPIIAICDFSSEHDIIYPQQAFYFDQHRSKVYLAGREDAPYQFRPYKQYRRSLTASVDNLLRNIGEVSAQDHSKLLRSIACLGSLQTNDLEHNYLLLWSALETLFRSSQESSAIHSIRCNVPNILSQRCVFYLIFDFIRSCNYCQMTEKCSQYGINVNNPQDTDIQNACVLLRDAALSSIFIQECEDKYVLLAEQAKELVKILQSSSSILYKSRKYIQTLSYNLQRMYRVRNKLVHHSEVDVAMEALYKHLLVYLWESIREISYLSPQYTSYSLENIFAYFRLKSYTKQQKLQRAGASFDFSLLK